MKHDELVAELRRALAHLDDPPYLETLSIATDITRSAIGDGLSRGQALRRALRLAIAALDPGIDSLPDPLDARAYQVLYRYAVARESMTAIGAELGISSRHAYRELQLATEALARIYSEMTNSDDAMPVASKPRNANGIRHELERLSSGATSTVEMRDLLVEIVEDLQPLASERGIEIRPSLDTSRLHVTAKRVMLRQAVLNLISHALGAARGASVFITLARASARDRAMLKIGYRVPSDAQAFAPRDSPYGVAAALLELMAISWAQSDAHGERWFTLEVPLIAERSVLIIDDNPGLIQLFRRFLHSHPYRVSGAVSVADAKRLLEDDRPDVIILDVMMPDRDGWELLRTLRQDDAGHSYRIIICSIVNDPGLAAALGADAFLHKPVDRASLLQSLDAVLLPSE